MLAFKISSLRYFANIWVHISPHTKKLDIFKIYTKWAVEKCPRGNFWTPRKPRNPENKSGNSIVGHPVLGISQAYIRYISGIYQILLPCTFHHDASA